MEEAFKDFRVVLEKEGGTITSHSPAQFRLMARCPDTLALDECVKRYNARMRREGIRETATLKLWKTPGR